VKSLLVVDSDPVMLCNFVAVLKSRGHFFNLLTATDGDEALQLLERFHIDLLIASLHVRGMDGFKLLTRVNQAYPRLRVIVMTDQTTPLVQASIEHMENAVELTGPVNADAFQERVFTELQIEYGGQVRGISLASFLQMLELEEIICRLEVSAENNHGYLYFDQGALVAARTGLSFGKEAVLEILTWDRPLIDIDYSQEIPEREIVQPLMSLLIESRKLADEKAGGYSNKREHARLGCLLSVDYDLQDWTYRSLVRDISLGGAYIETDQPIRVGQSIVLSLSAAITKRICTVSGRVVRRDNRGVGVQFEELSLRQYNFIKAIMDGERLHLTARQKVA
jgi:CheY-like chemotaxis protein